MKKTLLIWVGIVITVGTLIVGIANQTYFICEDFSNSIWIWLMRLQWGLYCLLIIFFLFIVKRIRPPRMLYIFIAGTIFIYISVFAVLNEGIHGTITLYSSTITETENNISYIVESREQNTVSFDTFSFIPAEELVIGQTYDWIKIEYHKNYFGKSCYIKDVSEFYEGKEGY